VASWRSVALALPGGVLTLRWRGRESGAWRRIGAAQQAVRRGLTLNLSVSIGLNDVRPGVNDVIFILPISAKIDAAAESL